jgi:aspartyl-tRNA(Asn)/glutamyl-tRNA(Gln) amidotransferase subunit A
VRTLSEQAAAVSSREVSPVELVERCLADIEAVEIATNAFTSVLPDEAMDRAKLLADSAPLGPLHGVPVAVKDLYDIAGVPTTGCCAAYLDRVPGTDSPVVARLREAGAIVVAKTNMHELAFGATTQVSCFGGVRNPWDRARIPAGSSGGSGAAVAAGAVAMAMGSDTGGSIRLPSAMCGVTGLKPTHGAVSLRGALPMTASFDTAGPLAVSARDCALVHEIICGFDPDYVYSDAGQPPAVKAPAHTRVALLRNWFGHAEAEVIESVEAAARELERLGYTVVEKDGPEPVGTRNEVAAVLTGEFAHHFPDLWDDPRVSDPIRALMDVGRQMTAENYVAGREAAQRVRQTFMKLFDGVDALLSPCAPYPAPLIDEVDNLTEAVRSTIFTLPVNAAGLPAVAFPVGFSAGGLPLGAQLIGPAWSELALCTVVEAFQAESDWHLRRPEIS